MSAGSGIRHSEKNLSKTIPLRLLQLWILPNNVGLKPQYGGIDGTTAVAKETRRNKWAHVITWSEENKLDVPIQLDQDVNIFLAEVDAGTALDFKILHGRQAYIVGAEGLTELAAVSSSSGFKDVIQLMQGDAAEAYGDLHLSFTAQTAGFWVIVEMRWTGGISKVSRDVKE